MTSEQIAELRKLEAVATRAPWRADTIGTHGDVEAYIEPENAWQRARVAESGLPGWPVAVIGSGDLPADEAIGPEDAALVVAMRNALTRLLDERDALLKAADEVMHHDRYSRMLEEAVAKAEAP